MPHFFSENRLLNLTLDDINAQRLKQGATPVVAPMTTRASTAQGTINTVQAQQNFQNQQFNAANQRYADTQAYFDANKGVLNQVNAQIKAQNNPLAGMTEEQMRQATGTFGTATDKGLQFVTGQGQAKDVLSQAGEGASLAKLRASLNLAGLPDITQDQQFLADWNNTMKTKALGGTPEAIRQKDGTMKVTAPYSTDSNFRELAAQRLRKAIKENSKVGYTESDIEKFLSSTAYTDPIKETASNTGLGGTFDDKGKFVPRTVAEAQNVLATSRSATERAQAQKVIDDELGQIKGYVPRTVTDQYGATYTTYSENAEATKKAQEEAKNRMAVEEQNRINLQKLKDDAKKKVSLMVPKDIQDTDEKLQQLKAVLDSLSPELRASAQYEIQTMINGQRRLSKATEDALNTFMTDEEIDKSYDGTEARIKQVEQKFIELADDSRKTAERVANYNRDMLMIDKKIIEQRAAEEETKQMQANIKNERKLRRQLGALGITTDLQGLQFLDDAIQEGQSTLASLRNANSLTLLKAQLAIGEGYALEMQKAIDSQKASYLDITTKTTDALIAVKKSISLDKKEKNKGIRDILAKDAEEKNKLETDTAKALRDLTKETNNMRIEEIKFERQLENDRKKDELIERKAQEALSKEDRSRVDSAKKEKQKTLGGVTDDLQTREWYKNFKNTGVTFSYAIDTFEDYKAGKVPETTLQEVATMAYAKLLDSNSVVRIEEFKRATQGTGLEGAAQKITDSINGGRGFPEGLAEGFMEVVSNIYNRQKESAMSELQPLLRRVKDFNIDYEETGIKIDPSTIFPIDLLPLSDSAKNAVNMIDDEQAFMPSSLIYDLALEHQKHEGYGSPNATTITRNNNPGALRWHPSQAQFGGVKDSSGFTKFPDYNSGFSALMADLSAKIGGKSSHIDYSNSPTFYDYVAVYAPKEDRNNPTSYASALVRGLKKKGYNIDLDTPLSDLSLAS